MGYGCCLGDAAGMCDSPGLGNIPWGYLGDDTIDENVSTLDTSQLGLPGGILDPSGPPISVGELQNYVQTGSADPGILGQLATLVQTAGPTVQSILQQVQFGQLAATTPINQLPMLRSAVLGQGGLLSSSFVAGNIPTSALLIGGALLLFMLSKKKRG